MTKKEMIQEIIEAVEMVDCSILRVYGVPMGVGYDLAVKLETKTDIIRLDAHATRPSWAAMGHLRPNNPYYKYTGSCDYYQEDVIKYWEHKKEYALEEYFSRMKKDQLKNWYQVIVK